eukprot:CAMPEP_0182447560 /NCGR_PEP_ID=MMETSP1172-20130603/17457_1 /TAXON_ID=708627 /ORGANISM="Timspurckia oligopyrenoides, Strain CCMP3278" /LENGTH=556 /DNA_ID=CAMNT_0024644047 /DNA_START=84 /DNA_END=1751 /DNA_ORIENTATION=-
MDKDGNSNRVELQRNLIRSCRQRGISLQRDSLQSILDFYMAHQEEFETHAHFQKQVMLTLAKLSIDGAVLHLNAVEEMLEKLRYDVISRVNENQEHKSTGNPYRVAVARKSNISALQVIDTMTVPTLAFEVDRELPSLIPFQYSRSPFSSSANKKGELWRARYDLLLRRTLRNPGLSIQSTQSSKGRNKKSGSQGEKLSLTKSEALLGTSGIKTIFGLLCSVEEGEWFIEDPFGIVKLDLSVARIQDCGLVQENNFVLAFGEMREDALAFLVHGICHPPLETREESNSNLRNLNVFGGYFENEDYNALLKLEESAISRNSLVFISELHLDNTHATNAFYELLKDVSSDTSQVPEAIVICGNFLSWQFGLKVDDIDTLQALFLKLGIMIGRIPVLARKCTFVLIPGPTDPGLGSILPRAPIPEFLVSGMRKHVTHLVLAPNPARIRLYTHTIVVCRDEMMQKCARHIVPIQSESIESDNEQHSFDVQRHIGCRPSQVEHLPVLEQSQKLVQCILHQSHLSPLPFRASPVLWQHDQALWLYPLPNVLVLADQIQSFAW